MKKSLLSLLSLLAAGGAVLLVAGCANTNAKVQYLPVPAYEGIDSVALLDPGVQHSVTCTRLQEKTLPDGRLEVIAQLRNLENRRIEVQANCVFKDQSGFSTGDETPFVMVILTENATEDVKFDSMNNLAKKYTIGVRQAR
jgi:hypothetical protein